MNHRRGYEDLCATRLGVVVTEQVLRAPEPAALTSSLQAMQDVTCERARLDTNWQQPLQCARYDIDLAQRRYQAVVPANRLVAPRHRIAARSEAVDSKART